MCKYHQSFYKETLVSVDSDNQSVYLYWPVIQPLDLRGSSLGVQQNHLAS